MLKEDIKKDMVTAMKEKDTVTRDILRVLTGELERNFITEDAKVIRTIKKLISNLKETDGDQEEIDILEDYLPQQLTETEMRHLVKEVITDEDLGSISGMGVIMNYFKNNYDGRYDGRILSIIVKSELS